MALTADELRSVEEGTHLVVELADEEYWMQGEGHVEYVNRYDSGRTVVGLKGLQGHMSKLRIPADAREGLRYDGAARGANYLRVDQVRERHGA